ncbi:MAG TPA: dTDP-4-dehydrorhamnose reductase [Clostridia bacterium]|nr:dTDP-4-dehydrorhamnose reductase [Clostridia bacterium]
MKFTKTNLRGVVIVEPVVFGDNRGYFMETYNEGEFTSNGIFNKFMQDNQSFSSQKGIVRGLHFQKDPHSQAKLVRCNKGAILDVAVDIKKGSSTYLQYVGAELTEENKRMLMIPRGYAHGFLTLTDDVEVIYKADNLYNKESDRSVRYNDSAIGINWGVENPILSAKDTNNHNIEDTDNNYAITVLVTGVNGQLGHDVVKRCQELGYNAIGADIGDFDITDEDATFKFITNCNPDVVVHCAAYTAVDKAESDVERCTKINVTGTENIAKAVKTIDATMVYISTDYVYGGKGDQAHNTDSELCPLNVYGKSKLDGENVAAKFVDKLFIVRTSWVFGINGNNFIKTMLKLAKERDELSVIDDQVGSPTYTPDLARIVVDMISTNKYGVYHATNENYCSWYEFATEIFKQSNINIKVNKTTSDRYVTAAVRPLNSKLDKSCLDKAGFERLPSWQDALKRYLEELNK